MKMLSELECLQLGIKCKGCFYADEKARKKGLPFCTKIHRKPVPGLKMLCLDRKEKK